MFKKLLVVSLLAAAVSGCAVSVGSGYGVDKIKDATQESLEKQFAPGVATRQQVALQLGAPSDKSTAGGLDIWNYRYARNAAVGIAFVGIPVGSRKVASFYFDEMTGILKKTEYQVTKQ